MVAPLIMAGIKLLGPTLLKGIGKGIGKLFNKDNTANSGAVAQNSIMDNKPKPQLTKEQMISLFMNMAQQSSVNQQNQTS